MAASEGSNITDYSYGCSWKQMYESGLYRMCRYPSCMIDTCIHLCRMYRFSSGHIHLYSLLTILIYLTYIVLFQLKTNDTDILKDTLHSHGISRLKCCNSIRHDSHVHWQHWTYRTYSTVYLWASMGRKSKNIIHSVH